MKKLIKNFFAKIRETEKKEKETKQSIIYRMYKEKKKIDDIVKVVQLDKSEIMELLLKEKKIRRGE